MPYIYNFTASTAVTSSIAFPLPSHTVNHVPLCAPLPIHHAELLHAPQLAHHVPRLPKIHLLQQIPHLQLHVLDKPPDVADVVRVARHRELGLDLPRHVAREVDGPEDVGVCGGGLGEAEHDRRGQLVCRRAGPVADFEDMDGVPGAGGGRVWRRD